MIEFPGLTDVHVHMREPGAAHKEDWHTGTAAALAGGITTVLAMPNTAPPVTGQAALQIALAAAKDKALCDYGQYLGAGPDNATEVANLAPHAAGLKMYLDHTYGELRLDEMPLWMAHFAAWPKNLPIAVHAEKRTLAAAILMADLYKRPLHICHVSRREEILMIKKAKEQGLPITCEVAPHHLFLTEEDIPAIGTGFGEVRPVLATKQDQQALWDNLDVIDCFATDHAPHTPAEKASQQPPPGFPGLETALPLYLTAVKEGRLTLEDILTRMVTNPKKIFNLPPQHETTVQVDIDYKWEIIAENMHSRAQWTPFAGFQVYGAVRSVTLRSVPVFQDGKILVQPGFGKNIRA
jgi:carbamoyl-phosphate synthase/aspartate carbamoyltransferase/dihydroorotase